MNGAEETLAAFAAGTLVLPAQRPDPVVAREPLEDSPSETVRRHASAFVRTWPDPPRDPDAYRLPPPVPKTAVRVGAEALGDARSSRTQAAKTADAEGWSWIAHLATSPTDPDVESLVMRFRLPGAHAFMCRRVVASWRHVWRTAKGEPVRRWEFVDAWAWQELGGGPRDEWEHLAGNAITAHLREAPTRPGRRVPKYTRPRCR